MTNFTLPSIWIGVGDPLHAKRKNQDDQTPKCDQCSETATCIVIFNNRYWRGVGFFCDKCADGADEKLRPKGYPGNIGRRVVLYEDV